MKIADKRLIATAIMTGITIVAILRAYPYLDIHKAAIWQVLTYIFLILSGTAGIISLLYYFHVHTRESRAIWQVAWKKSSSFTPQEILGERPFHRFYYQRRADKLIRKLIENERNVLVIGRPLSGKTRAFFEALVSLVKPCDVIIPKYVEEIETKSFCCPRHFAFWRDRILLLDDLHRFIEVHNFEHLLRFFLQTDTILVASCRSEMEFERVKIVMAEKGISLSSIFGENVIRLERLSKEEGRDIAKKVGKRWKDIKFDHTIGSIFMPLEEMEKRFIECEKEEKLVLRSVKLLHLCGLTLGRSDFLLKWIKIVCRKKFRLDLKYEWDALLEELAKKEFILIKSDKMIWAEEAYIENIVKMKAAIPIRDILVEMQTIFGHSFFPLARLGERAHNLGYFDIGDKAYEKALGLRPNNIFAWINRAQNLGKQTEYEKALECVNRALELDPANVFAWHNEGFYLSKLGQYDDAIECYNKSIELDPSYAPAWYNKGYSLHKLRRDEEAIRCYDRALELDPDNKVTLNNKGGSLAVLGKNKDAIECYDKALKIDSKFVNSWNDKGRVLGKLGRYEESLSCLDTALDLALKCELDKSDPECVALVWDNKGYILNEQKRWEEAIRCFDEALRLDPSLASAWHNKIYASFHNSAHRTLQGIFEVPAVLVRSALSKVDNKEQLIASINRGSISFFKNLILECKINSMSELLSLLKEFDSAFGNLGIRTPSRSQINVKCGQSKKFQMRRDKIRKIFGDFSA